MYQTSFCDAVETRSTQTKNPSAKSARFSVLGLAIAFCDQRRLKSPGQLPGRSEAVSPMSESGTFQVREHGGA